MQPNMQPNMQQGMQPNMQPNMHQQMQMQQQMPMQQMQQPGYQQMQQMPPMQQQQAPGADRNNSQHPMLSDQFVVLRRPPPLPEVRVRCARDEKCVKENGHRGRCSLQHRPREDDMLRLVDQVRQLQQEVETVKADRDRLQNEVSTLWSKLAKSCMFLSNIVRSKRENRSTASPTAEECQRELKKVCLECQQFETEEKREQFTASLTLLESAMASVTSPDELARRQAEADAYKRQFEADMHQMREAHNAHAESDAADIVPYMMVAQTMTATEKIIGGRPEKQLHSGDGGQKASLSPYPFMGMQHPLGAN
eukprot:CAMPEP_0119408050 /NCGR_PEP_ID=MMETSP1335-20130426/1729_1 /TAXON_ID=259385 /ORGANISM="Chrysoculter rhomboideus, Strain RCC1486" /LENGTH=308 /DNA_ID=CAMNT_0007432239 /DNA_START=1 /DNA_END=927 /DNA_ORIENTATION=-